MFCPTGMWYLYFWADMLLCASWTHPSSLVCNCQPCPHRSGCLWPMSSKNTCTCLCVLALRRMPFKPKTGIRPLSDLSELTTDHFVESKPQNHIKQNRQLRARIFHTIKNNKHLLKMCLYHPRYYLKHISRNQRRSTGGTEGICPQTLENRLRCNPNTHLKINTEL